MINSIAIISVPVSGQQAAKRFYTEALGLDIIRDNPMGPDQQWIQLGLRGAQTSFTLVTWFESMPAGSLSGIVLETGDVAAEVARLKARGLAISDVQSQLWGAGCDIR
ncbi:MAG: VOC family protein [Candidatus Devosia euplotis]|nr:VOC family protein [Candidatus Devosia euplotis]